ncbi:bactofilin family protein [Paenibacillus harenae]|uniref:bactofilin family protein n=1 Tax=Paenibacillus harenae TaxID=306543 RepID=UPI002793D757|nr:polymer-forming cytoskeletal protein [Paenibacillus harenae]MDQ0060602.1 cytoskeletal protein CcmA (bactofilin family) [Paenibacillus harenae]
MFKDNKRVIATDTLIGQGTLTEGKMICDASLRIEGEYRGDIECKGNVIIGECGIARSNIAAQDVTVAGKVIGDITTKGRLIITSSGQVEGSLYANILIVQDGGIINGNCQMELPKDAKGKGATDADSAHAVSGKEHGGKEGKEKSRQAG